VLQYHSTIISLRFDAAWQNARWTRSGHCTSTSAHKGSPAVTPTRGSRLIRLGLSKLRLFSGPSDSFLDHYLVEIRNRVAYLARLIPERSASSWHFLHVVVDLQSCVTRPILASNTTGPIISYASEIVETFFAYLNPTNYTAALCFTI
jgi:hypothetical protein